MLPSGPPAPWVSVPPPDPVCPLPTLRRGSASLPPPRRETADGSTYTASALVSNSFLFCFLFLLFFFNYFFSRRFVGCFCFFFFNYFFYYFLNNKNTLTNLASKPKAEGGREGEVGGEGMGGVDVQTRTTALKCDISQK